MMIIAPCVKFVYRVSKMCSFSFIETTDHLLALGCASIGRYVAQVGAGHDRASLLH